jgi:hypothetical protein
VKIADFIRDEILLRRLNKHEVLVVYDSEGRYRDLCLSLAAAKDGDNAHRDVVDATESSILAREATLAALQQIGSRNLDQLLVYVPAGQTVTDEARMHDPFALAAVCGTVFPNADLDGDQFQQICLRAKPEYSAEIREVFTRDSQPSFAVIDHIGGGNNYPQLQEILRVESARGLLLALLNPTATQQKRLEASKAWVTEARQLVKDTLGISLKTRGETWPTIANELWQLLLFSEFLFDLPAELPAGLRDVSCASADKRALVEDVCDRLRDSISSRSVYIERAEKLERDLNLPAHCADLEDLGLRDTFPFEERTFMRQAIATMATDNLEKVHTILQRRTQSVWSDRGDHQTQWELVRQTLALVEMCATLEAELAEQAQTQTRLIDFYTRAAREADRLQREMENHVVAIFADELRPVVQHGRRVYRDFTNRIQTAFVRHLEQSGWPPTGYISTTQLFDRLIKPKLAASGQRVAVILIDALRYELGVELEKRLSKMGPSEIGVACAPLPTVTPLGMAALLPAADSKLRLLRQQNRMAVQYDNQLLSNVNQRLGVYSRLFGERVAHFKLRDVAQGTVQAPATVDLLLVRSSETDETFEHNADAGFEQIRTTFRYVTRAVERLAALGFHDVVILTDHGFALNPDVQAGDVGEKPSGNWVNVHERLLLGDGTADNNNWVLDGDRLGIRGDFAQAAGPRALVAYRAGETYLHGGASLPEAVVPYLLLKLKTAESATGERPHVKLDYKRKRITTKRPVIDVTVGPVSSLLAAMEEIELLIEAHDEAGNVVGQAQGGDGFDEMTGVVRLRPNTTGKVTLSMNRTFEGSFVVKALDPTLLTIYFALPLETDYMVL